MDSTLRDLERLCAIDPSQRPRYARALTLSRDPIIIEDIRPRWMDGSGNMPTLDIKLNRMPKSDEKVYTNPEGTSLYYSEVGPLCSFFSYTKPGGGYGGSHFKILMDDGSYKVLKGPWSSGCYAMNRHGLGPCMSVSLTTSDKDWKRGYTYCGGAILVEAVLPLLEQKGLGLCLMDSHCYEPTSRKKYSSHGPYYNKAADPERDTRFKLGPFQTVKEEILAPTDQPA